MLSVCSVVLLGRIAIFVSLSKEAVRALGHPDPSATPVRRGDWDLSSTSTLKVGRYEA